MAIALGIPPGARERGAPRAMSWTRPRHVPTGNPLKLEEKVGASTAIAGVFIYSVIDELLGKKGAGAGPKVSNPMASPAMSTRSRTKKAPRVAQCLGVEQTARPLPEPR